MIQRMKEDENEVFGKLNEKTKAVVNSIDVLLQ